MADRFPHSFKDSNAVFWQAGCSGIFPGPLQSNSSFICFPKFLLIPLQKTKAFLNSNCQLFLFLLQDPAGNWTTGRQPDYHKEMHTAVVWSCLPFIRSGQNHLARHSERGKKTRQTKEEVGRQHQGKDRPRVRQVPDGSERTGKNGENWLQNHLWCANDPRS